MINHYGIAIHGGAGTILRNRMTPEKEKQYKQSLANALQAGHSTLKQGGTALAAVEAAVRVMEDDPLFNAGRGSVFTHKGTHEMDASIMCGQSLKAGAVAGVEQIQYPTTLAKKVMEETRFVLLGGQEALAFAQEMKVAIQAPEFFYTEQRYRQLQNAKNQNAVVLDHDASVDVAALDPNEKKYGTVGAVALDQSGNLAAATSSGGLTNKQYGRIGDSALVGAGTYANNATCAVSCTGIGEFFIRGVVAYDVSCLMEYKGLSLKAACAHVIHEKQIALGGEGGLIAIDGKGNIALPFNSEGMYRAAQLNTEAPLIAIW